MKKLTQAQQAKATQFIREQARPCEQHRYAVYFENASAEPVLNALAAFQNEDGGFGQALEPDLRLPQSSAMSTVRGLQILCEVNTPSDHPLVNSVIRYLLNTYDAERKVWPIIPSIIYDGKQAPWWAYSEELSAMWRGFLANPRAEIVACLHHYPQLLPEGLLDDLSEGLAAHLENPPEGLEMHDFLSYAYLLESKILPDALQERMLKAFKPLLEAVVVVDPAQWNGYALKPLSFVTKADSPLTPWFAEAIELQLDLEIEQQSDDGAWCPPWAWEGEAWKDAEKSWKGILTLQNLQKFKSFGRLD